MAYYNQRRLEKYQYRRQIESMSEGTYQGIACQERGGEGRGYYRTSLGWVGRGKDAREYDDRRYNEKRRCSEKGSRVWG